MIRKFSGEFGKIKALPTNVVIDRAGIVRYVQAGAFSLEDLNRLLVPLLSEPAPAG
jgi:cytochrome c biogenesis protein CcmG/thiol:disulfide interchange protein DsbE